MCIQVVMHACLQRLEPPAVYFANSALESRFATALGASSILGWAGCMY